MAGSMTRPSRRHVDASLAFISGARMPPPPVKRDGPGPEALVLRAVLHALRVHPQVAWCERMNSGQVEIEGRHLRAGWVGAPDVLGQLKDGRLLAVECKSATGRLTGPQRDFLSRVAAANGVAFVARSIDDVFANIPNERGIA